MNYYLKDINTSSPLISNDQAKNYNFKTDERDDIVMLQEMQSKEKIKQPQLNGMV